MKTRRSFELCEPWRWLATIAVAAAGMALIIGSGGGGSDGIDDGDDGDTVGILSQYNFQIGGPLAGDAGPSYIDVVFAGEADLNTQPNIQGTLSCNTTTEICELQSVAVGSVILVDDRTDPEVFTDFGITVEAEWAYDPAGSDFPDTGRVRIDPVLGNLFDIIVEVADCGAGGPGVLVSTDPVTQAVCYPWDAFEELENTAESGIERLAALGWSAINFTLEQGEYALQAFAIIDAYEEILATGDPFLEQCDAYAADWPGGPPNPGDFLFGWVDDNGDGEIGPGDSFRQEFESCWYDDPEDDIDELIDGVIEYVSYTEVVAGNLITRIGFEGTTNSRTGGIGYGDELGNDPLVLIETIEQGGTITPDDPITLSGRYVIVFFEP